MNIFQELAEHPQLQFWCVAGVIAVSMALGAFITYIFRVLPLEEQKEARKRKKAEKSNDTEITTEYYKNIIADLQNEVEFWYGNCRTAEDRYNKLYQEVHK